MRAAKMAETIDLGKLILLRVPSPPSKDTKVCCNHRRRTTDGGENDPSR